MAKIWQPNKDATGIEEFQINRHQPLMIQLDNGKTVDIFIYRNSVVIKPINGKIKITNSEPPGIEFPGR